MALRRHFDVFTAKPCDQDWQLMSGNAQARHCAACDKTVHNLAQMSSRDVERLALRAAMGEEVCARITRRVSDQELVTAPDYALRPSVRAGMLLSTAMLCCASGHAQQAEGAPLATATLTGRIMPPIGNQPLLARGVRLRPASGQDIFATLRPDGSFSVSVPPGTYDIFANNNYWQGVTVKSAVLHQGYQSMGDVQARVRSADEYEYTTTGGAMVSTISRAYGFRHPITYVRYVIHRVRAKFSQ